MLFYHGKKNAPTPLPQKCNCALVFGTYKQFPLCDKEDTADAIKVMDLKTRKLTWIIQLGTLNS